MASRQTADRLPSDIGLPVRKVARTRLLFGWPVGGFSLIAIDAISVGRYHRSTVIRSFRDDETEKVFLRGRPRKLPLDIQRGAQRKLAMLDAAESLQDLRAPPANRLEALSGDRVDQHSIRINVRWRVCFRWADGDTYDVEIVDYH